MATRTTGNRVWKLSWIKSLYTHTASILRGIIYNVGQGNKLCYINYKHITYIRRKSNIMFWSLGMYSPNFLIIAYCTIRYYGSTRYLRTNERVSQPNFNKNLSPVPVHKDVIWGPTSLKFKFSSALSLSRHQILYFLTFTTNWNRNYRKMLQHRCNRYHRFRSCSRHHCCHRHCRHHCHCHRHRYRCSWYSW